jgi:hypothetical protein
MPRIGICNRRIDTCAHDVARCARFGRAGLLRRIRRAPWRSPDLVRSGPSRVTSAFDHCGVVRSQPRMVLRALPRARFPIEEHPFRRLIHSTAGKPPHLSTMRDPRRERREPSLHPIPVLDRGSECEAPVVVWPGHRCHGHGPEGARFASVIDTTCEHEAACHRPRSTPW